VEIVPGNSFDQERLSSYDKRHAPLLGAAVANGYIMKTKTIVIAILSLLPFTAAAQTADEIVAKALAARGGVDKLKAVQTERVSGIVSFAPGVEGTFVVELKRTHKMHMEIMVDEQKIIRVYDGKSSGWVVNPFASNKDVQPMEADDLKSIADEADFDGPMVDYKAKGNQIEYVGKEVFDDKPVYRLKLTSAAGGLRFYVFDANTYLLVKWEGTRKIENKDVPWESYFSDYREVNGMKYAFRIDAGSPGTDVKQALITEKMEINPEIDDAHFGKPTVSAPRAASSAPSSER
jgi:outer membrane lipoprotein-sorting protein